MGQMLEELETQREKRLASRVGSYGLDLRKVTTYLTMASGDVVEEFQGFEAIEDHFNYYEEKIVGNYIDSLTAETGFAQFRLPDDSPSDE